MFFCVLFFFKQKTAYELRISDCSPDVCSSDLSLKGVLVNNCAEAAAAELKVDAKNDGGEIIHTESGWPAGSNNIAPGARPEFDLGPLFRYNDKIQYFGVRTSRSEDRRAGKAYDSRFSSRGATYH